MTGTPDQHPIRSVDERFFVDESRFKSAHLHPETNEPYTYEVLMVSPSQAVRINVTSSNEVVVDADKTGAITIGGVIAKFVVANPIEKDALCLRGLNRNTLVEDLKNDRLCLSAPQTIGRGSDLSPQVITAGAHNNPDLYDVPLSEIIKAAATEVVFGDVEFMDGNVVTAYGRTTAVSESYPTLLQTVTMNSENPESRPLLSPVDEATMRDIRDRRKLLVGWMGLQREADNQVSATWIGMDLIMGGNPEVERRLPVVLFETDSPQQLVNVDPRLIASVQQHVSGLFDKIAEAEALEKLPDTFRNILPPDADGSSSTSADHQEGSSQRTEIRHIPEGEIDREFHPETDDNVLVSEAPPLDEEVENALAGIVASTRPLPSPQRRRLPGRR